MGGGNGERDCQSNKKKYKIKNNCFFLIILFFDLEGKKYKKSYFGISSQLLGCHVFSFGLSRSALGVSRGDGRCRLRDGNEIHRCSDFVFHFSYFFGCSQRFRKF